LRQQGRGLRFLEVVQEQRANHDIVSSGYSILDEVVFEEPCRDAGSICVLAREFDSSGADVAAVYFERYTGAGGAPC
jgi:hypothetical protein